MNKFKPTNIKGAEDNTPQQQALRYKVIDTLRKNFEAYGYLPIETAQLNYLDLLTYKYDHNAEIVREIYKIKDQGDRDLGLRFDLTVPFCKYIAMNRNMKLPFKRYEIGKVWRNGPVKLGRTREFYQCDVDAVGITGPHIEAEIISMAIRCMLDLGITPVVEYGNRKLLPYSDAVIAVIDKMKKIKYGELIKELTKQNMTESEAVELVDAVECAPKIPEILELEKALEEMGVLKYCVYAPYLARGLNVYTGTVFEIFDGAGRTISSLGGGGRYDKIIGDFIDNGSKYPAVGISIGLEPVMALLALSRWGMGEGRSHPIDLMLIPLGTESFCQKHADKLRAEGKKVLVYFGGKSLAKAFEYAAANNIRHAAVIGEDEVKGKQIVIKELSK